LANVSAILFTILVGLVTAEILAYAPHIARWLIKRAVRKLADTDRERYLEEWLSHAEQLPGHLTKLLHALDCELRGARRIAVLSNDPSTAGRKIVLTFARAYYFARLAPKFLPSLVRFAYLRQFWKCRLTWAIEKSLVNAVVYHIFTEKLRAEQLDTALDAHSKKLHVILDELKAKLERNAQKRLQKETASASQE
jgi:hypothetical protein